MLELITEPKSLISGTTYSRVLSANNKAVFEWQRKDFSVDGGTLTGSNYLGLLALETSTLVTLSGGDTIYINSSTIISGYYPVLGMTPDGTKIVLDVGYLALGANDFVIIPNYRTNYYVEVRVTEQQLGEGYTKATVSNEGVASCDLKGLFRIIVSQVDEMPHSFADSQTTAHEYEDINSSNQVVIAVREVYQGGSSAWQNIENDYLVVDAALAWNESNMRNFLLAKIEAPYKPKFLTLFKELHYWQLYPFDVQALVYLNTSSGNIAFSAQRKTLNNTNIGIALSFTISEIGTEVKYLRFMPFVSRAEKTVIDWYNTARTEFKLTESVQGNYAQIAAKKDDLCQKNPIYVKWRNSLGGWSYWLFSSNTPEYIEGDSANIALITESSNQREIALGVKSQRVVTLGADHLTDVEAWMDFVKQKNVWVLKSAFFGELTDVEFTGTIATVTQSNHGLVDGDTLQVLFNDDYQGTYTITSYTDNTFSFDAGASTPFVVGSYWRKVINENDWVLHTKDNDETTITREGTAFSITFDIRKPSETMRL